MSEEKTFLPLKFYYHENEHISVRSAKVLLNEEEIADVVSHEELVPLLSHPAPFCRDLWHALLALPKGYRISSNSGRVVIKASTKKVACQPKHLYIAHIKSEKYIRLISRYPAEHYSVNYINEQVEKIAQTLFANFTKQVVEKYTTAKDSNSTDHVAVVFTRSCEDACGWYRIACEEECDD